MGSEVVPGRPRLPLLRHPHDPLQISPQVHLHRARAVCGNIIGGGATFQNLTRALPSAGRSPGRDQPLRFEAGRGGKRLL